MIENMKTIYLSLLFLCLGLTTFAQKSNRIIVHVEGGAKFDVRSNDYADERGFSGYQFFVSGLYPISENFAAGVGAGVNVYTRYDEIFDKITSVPVYANAVYKIPTSKDFVSYVDLKLGYGIVSRDYIVTRILEIFPEQRQELNVKNSGGLYVSPSIGYLFPWDDRAFTVSLSYDLQLMKAKYSEPSGPILEQTKTHSNTFALRVGFMF